ncbi:MAG TPA: hypothetical protein VFR58_16410 [Flavisolibacter sp.]|nr:hypothetical protein [Flavisolibacter sp.]
MAFLALTGAFASNAQVFSKFGPKQDWMLRSVNPNVTDINAKHGGDYQGAMIYLPGEEVITPVSLNKGYGLVRLDKKGAVKWQAEMPGYIIGLAKKNGHLLAFYRVDEPKYIVVDMTTGEKLQDQPLYTNGPKISVDLFVLRDSADELKCIVINETVPKFMATSYKTYLMNIKDMGGELKPPIDTDGMDVMAFLANGNGDLFVANCKDDFVQVTKYNAQGGLVKTLTTNIKAKKNVAMCFRKDAGEDKVLLATSYLDKRDGFFSLTRFDFAAATISYGPTDEINKTYLSGIEKIEVKGLMRRNFEGMDELQAADIILAGDKIIVIKEYYYLKASGTPSRPTSRPTSEGLVVSFYDRNLKPLKSIGLNRWNETLTSGSLSIGHHVYGNKLYLVFANIRGIMSHANVFSTIDLAAMKFEDNKVLDHQNYASFFYTEGASTIWFDKSLLINYPLPSGNGSKRGNCVFQHVSLSE